MEFIFENIKFNIFIKGGRDTNPKGGFSKYKFGTNQHHKILATVEAVYKR